MVVFLLRIDRDTNYNFILLIIEKLIIIFYLLFLLWLTHQRRGMPAATLIQIAKMVVLKPKDNTA